MNQEIVNGLAKLLHNPSIAGRRIVTWYDADGANTEYLDDIKQALSDDGIDVEIVVFDDNPPNATLAFTQVDNGVIEHQFEVTAFTQGFDHASCQ